jgi:uncharacterized protein with HEPN domain
VTRREPRWHSTRCSTTWSWIGEAVNALPAEITAQEPDVPWRDIVDMRNFLSHEYFRVLADVVRRTLDEPLEQLRAACHRLLASIVR